MRPAFEQCLQLLGSKTITDVTEVTDLVVTAVQFGLPFAEVTLATAVAICYIVNSNV